MKSSYALKVCAYIVTLSPTHIFIPSYLSVSQSGDGDPRKGHQVLSMGRTNTL